MDGCQANASPARALAALAMIHQSGLAPAGRTGWCNDTAAGRLTLSCLLAPAGLGTCEKTSVSAFGGANGPTGLARRSAWPNWGVDEHYHIDGVRPVYARPQWRQTGAGVSRGVCQPFSLTREPLTYVNRLAQIHVPPHRAPTSRAQLT